MSEIIRVFICDDHTLFRQGIRKLLELEGDIKIIGEANNGLEMLNMLNNVVADVILMDIAMPQMDGVIATYKVKELFPSSRVIILTVYEDEPHIFQAIKAGAMGYLLKDVSIEQLTEAVRKVYKGEALIQPVIAAKVLKEFTELNKRKEEKGTSQYAALTEREQEILHLISFGNTNKEIASKLGISVKTVKNHISNIFSVIHVNNRTKAALFCLDKKPDVFNKT